LSIASLYNIVALQQSDDPASRRPLASIHRQKSATPGQPGNRRDQIPQANVARHCARHDDAWINARMR